MLSASLLQQLSLELLAFVAVNARNSNSSVQQVVDELVSRLDHFQSSEIAWILAVVADQVNHPAVGDLVVGHLKNHLAKCSIGDLQSLLEKDCFVLQREICDALVTQQKYSTSRIVQLGIGCPSPATQMMLIRRIRQRSDLDIMQLLQMVKGLRDPTMRTMAIEQIAKNTAHHYSVTADIARGEIRQSMQLPARETNAEIATRLGISKRQASKMRARGELG